MPLTQEEIQAMKDQANEEIATLRELVDEKTLYVVANWYETAIGKHRATYKYLGLALRALATEHAS